MQSFTPTHATRVSLYSRIARRTAQTSSSNAKSGVKPDDASGVDALYTFADESNMMLVGFIGFVDPPKPSAKYALKLLRRRGVRVKVLTGTFFNSYSRFFLIIFTVVCI
jgi:magnesium-transporting ATPase (P-type)